MSLMNTFLRPAATLRHALWADALVSGGAGALQVVGGDALAASFGLPAALGLGSGVFLLGYAALLVAMARAARLPAALLALVVAGNVGWAIGCAALLAAMPLSMLGAGWLVLQALSVLVFAAWEGAGWRASQPAMRSALA